MRQEADTKCVWNKAKRNEQKTAQRMGWMQEPLEAILSVTDRDKVIAKLEDALH